VRTRFWERGVLIVMAVVGMALAGCGGTQPVAASAIIGVVPPCVAGSAHPNVCCRDGVCTASLAEPFDMCPAGALLFPDRRRCCPLAGGDCVDAPLGDGGTDPIPGSSCTLPCGPESHAPAAPDLVCGTGPLTASCDYCCSGLGCVTDICHCPVLSTCQCGPACDSCPAGWSAPAPQVDLCCASPTHCFSQSVNVQAPEGGGTFIGPDGCESTAMAGGQLYDLKCDAKTSSCTCSFDGTTTKQFAFASGGACDIRSCGFPP
jgi:hypothetical protein